MKLLLVIVSHIALHFNSYVKVAHADIYDFQNVTQPNKDKEYTSIDVPSHDQSNRRTRPNIMIIMADDIGIGDIKGKVNTMNVDALAGKGMSFLNAHATPVCATSRYSLLSGNYQFRGRAFQGMWGMDSGSNFRRKQISLAKILKERGDYRTSVVGKWHLGAKIRPRGLQTGLDEILTSPLHNWELPLGQGARYLGFESSYVTNKGIQGPPYSFFRDDFLENKDVVNFTKEQNYSMPHGLSKIGKPGQGSSDWDSSAYNMILVNETEKFLDKHMMDPQKPFFSYVALGAVHVPHSPPDKHLNGDPIAGQYATSHMDMILEMDKTVGAIVKALEDRKLTTKTLIMFLSDNGGLGHQFGSDKFGHHSNAGLRGYKGEIYEGGHRIPLIVRYDGVIPAGKNHTALVGISDIYSTICDFARIEKPKSPSAKDSISFASILKNPTNEASPRKFLYVTRYTRGKLVAEAGITQSFKLVQFFKNQNETSLEYYNLKQDPMETKNLIKESKYKEDIEKMLKRFYWINKVRP